MKIETKESQGIQIIAFEGNLDTNTSPEAESVINELIDAGKQKILVNFEQLSFISSAGLKALLSALMKVRKMIPPGDVVISEIKPELRESFDLVGFDRLFKFYDDNLHAVGSF